MVWIILTFIFGWLLCGMWALRMGEKDDTIVSTTIDGIYHSIFGPIRLFTTFFTIWPDRIVSFYKRFIKAWREAKSK